MATLREIRRRIKSVENIKQITKSMEMVAAARLHKASLKAEQTGLFYRKMEEVLNHVLESSEQLMHPFFEKRKDDNIGLLIVGADRGLSGSYNSNLFAAIDRFLEKYNKEKVRLYIFGKKALEHYERRKWNIRLTQLDWGGKTTFKDIKKISDQLFTSFLSHEFNELWMASTRYISIFNRKVAIEKFLPLNKAPKGKDKKSVDFVFEPKIEELLQELITRFYLAKIQAALDESYAAELAARVVSMGSATKNAEEMIHKLTLIRNKVRQASITKEMLEISASVEGMSGR